MSLTESNVLITAYAESKELRVPVSRITSAQVVVRGDEASVIQSIAREKRVRRRKGVIHPKLAIVVPDMSCTRIRVVVAAAGNILIRKGELPDPRRGHVWVSGR